MCVVYRLSLEDDTELIEKIEERYGSDTAGKFRNAEFYPKSEAPVIGPGGKVAILKWGFPIAGKKSVIVNARCETLNERPLFRDCAAKHCVVPAMSFFEWGLVGDKKQKFEITPGGLFYFAAIWKSFISSDGAKQFHFTIITTAPNAQMSAIHSRMPVIIEKGRENEWLDSRSFENRLLAPYGGTVRIEKSAKLK